jgi:hypothetical protein
MRSAQGEYQSEIVTVQPYIGVGSCRNHTLIESPLLRALVEGLVDSMHLPLLGLDQLSLSTTLGVLVMVEAPDRMNRLSKLLLK